VGVVFLHVGNVTHQQVTKNADEQGEVSHQGEVDGSSVQMDAIMDADVEGSSSVLHTSPGELRGWYDVCLLVCTPCCADALRLSQRLSRVRPVVQAHCACLSVCLSSSGCPRRVGGSLECTSKSQRRA
jgi:hypothetical protein